MSVFLANIFCNTPSILSLIFLISSAIGCIDIVCGDAWVAAIGSWLTVPVIPNAPTSFNPFNIGIAIAPGIASDANPNANALNAGPSAANPDTLSADTEFNTDANPAKAYPIPAKAIPILAATAAIDSNTGIAFAADTPNKPKALPIFTNDLAAPPDATDAALLVAVKFSTAPECTVIAVVFTVAAAVFAVNRPKIDPKDPARLPNIGIATTNPATNGPKIGVDSISPMKS